MHFEENAKLSGHREFVYKTMENFPTLRLVCIRLEKEKKLIVSEVDVRQALLQWQLEYPLKLSSLARARIRRILRDKSNSTAKVYKTPRDGGILISKNCVDHTRLSLRMQDREYDLAEGAYFDHREGFVVQSKPKGFTLWPSSTVIQVAEAVERNREASYDDRRLEPVEDTSLGGYGPDHIWIVDACNKLRDFGFYIYGVLDTYSKHVVGIHVSALDYDSQAPFALYLHCCAQEKIIPDMLLSNPLLECQRMKQAQHGLSYRMRHKPGERAFPERTCFSKEKHKELYCGGQYNALLTKWHNFFDFLSEAGSFKKEIMSNRIALLAVYMPILRDAITCYAELHNSTKPDGTKRWHEALRTSPDMLYSSPPLHQVDSYGFSIKPEYLNGWQEHLIDQNFEVYLPDATVAWCEQCLRANGYPVPLPATDMVHSMKDKPLHRQAYVTLRNAITRHIDFEGEPKLGEIFTPTFLPPMPQ